MAVPLLPEGYVASKLIPSGNGNATSFTSNVVVPRTAWGWNSGSRERETKEVNAPLFACGQGVLELELLRESR